MTDDVARTATRIANKVSEVPLRSALGLIRTSARSRPAISVIFIAGLLVTLHLATLIQVERRNLFRLDREGSISENWEAVLLLSCGAVFLLCCFRSRRCAFATPAVATLYMAFDGRMELHEHAARWIAPGRQDLGELVFMLFIGAAIGASLFGTYLYARPRERTALVAICVLMGAFGLAAAGVDALHAYLRTRVPILNEPLILIEDGGELLAITGLFAVAMTCLSEGARHNRSARHSGPTPSSYQDPGSPG